MEKEKCTSVLCPNCMDDFPEQTQGKQELSEAPRPVQTARRPVPSHPWLVEGHAAETPKEQCQIRQLNDSQV